MSATASRSPVNRLVAALPRSERVLLLAHCVKEQLPPESRLCEAHLRIRNVLFPVTGSISLLAQVAGHPPLEIGIVGNEGVLGASLVLGVQVMPFAARVHSAGSAWRLPAGRLLRLLPDCPMLERALAHSLYLQLAQLAQSAVCTHFHEIEPRLARCLLLSQDRADGERLHLTHQALADLLGVQRSAISIAAGKLQRRGLIHYSRGEIDIRDRPGLEAASCACYATVIEDNRRIGRIWRPRTSAYGSAGRSR
ncbi:MAG TPA: Crp/Fnr family transcriptional regulator [Arenimonas sp.]|nr:Crp/Fnr family transcriptional regulator [Arenimonas sp.]